MYQIDISDVPKFQDEPSEVNVNLGSVLSHVKKSTVWIKKDPTAQGDNDSPGLSPGLVGTGYVWHKNPAQKPLVDKRKSPRLVVGAYGVKPNASFPNPGLTQIAKDWKQFDAERVNAHEHEQWVKENNPKNLTTYGSRTIPAASSGKRYEASFIYHRNDLEDDQGNPKDTLQIHNSLHNTMELAHRSLPTVGNGLMGGGKNKVLATKVFYHGPKGTKPISKDAADVEPTDSPDNNGRPKWMASPGQGGKDPEYRSQKPGPNGNNDELFSENITTTHLR
ncbi:unnamed protein product [Sphagnum balticum]